MITWAVTGGIGSGKSLVCRFLAERGVPVYDSDAAGRRLYDTDDTLVDAVETAFGCGLRLPDGRMDRKRLASIVFPSPAKLETLESIVHPAILKDFLRWKTLQDVRGEQVAAMESAIILSKSAFLHAVDKVLLVDAPLPLRMSRACARDGADPAAIADRMARQHFDLSRVDETLWNDGTVEELRRKVDAFLAGLDPSFQK